jgi:hypothetical protein
MMLEELGELISPDLSFTLVSLKNASCVVANPTVWRLTSACLAISVLQDKGLKADVN